MVLRGAGMGASFMPAMTAAFAALDRSQVSHATPQLNVLNRVGGSIGTTILAVVLADAAAPRAHAGGRSPLLRHRLLVVRRDGRARDHPVRGPDARRVQRPQGREGRRRARIPTAPRWSPAPSRRRWRERHRRSEAPPPPADAPAAGSERDPRPLDAGRPAGPRRSSGRWSRCASCAGARPTGPARSATPSTGCCSAWRGCASARPASSPSTPT